MRNKALIFDMDGVIVDNVALHEMAWLEFCRTHQIKITTQLFREQLFGKSNSETLKMLTGKDLTDTELQKYIDEKEALYRKLCGNQLKPLKGLISILTVAGKMNVKTAVASSAPLKNITFTIAQTQTSHFFNVITSTEEIIHSKPHPEIFLITAEKLSVKPIDCLVFEDSFAGIEAAKRAGMKVIGVATTHSPESLPETDETITDFSKINMKKVLSLFR